MVRSITTLIDLASNQSAPHIWHEVIPFVATYPSGSHIDVARHCLHLLLGGYFPHPRVEVVQFLDDRTAGKLWVQDLASVFVNISRSKLLGGITNRQHTTRGSLDGAAQDSLRICLGRNSASSIHDRRDKGSMIAISIFGPLQVFGGGSHSFKNGSDQWKGIKRRSCTSTPSQWLMGMRSVAGPGQTLNHLRRVRHESSRFHSQCSTITRRGQQPKHALVSDNRTNRWQFHQCGNRWLFP